MASGSDELSENSSSAVKRRKIGNFDEIEKSSEPAELSHPKRKIKFQQQNSEDLEGSLSDNNGYSDLSDGLKSASTSSDATNSSSTPTRADSLSDDTGFPLDTADEKDEVSSTVSNLSELTGMSMLSDDDEDGMQWTKASSWVQKQIQLGTDPREILCLLFSDSSQIPEHVDDITLWRIVLNMMSEPPKRQKLSHINTVSDVVQLIKNSCNIIVLTGAGVSVSCGIPDFRSRDGIYSRLAQDFPDLPDPQAMFDINYFSQDPRPFYKFAREIYPGQFKPSPCHRFIKTLEKQNKLLRNYSQNIDTLERAAGIKNVIECHGSFATASCTKCKYQVPSDDIKKDIFAQTIPMCPKCKSNTLSSKNEITTDINYKDVVSQGVMKPDIVFFGEGLPDAFHDAMSHDKDICDLLIVIGSSLKVRPVALIPSSIPANVPQILINRESLSHLDFDVELLGDGDVIINQLCHMLDDNFKEVCWKETILQESSRLLPTEIFASNSWDQLHILRTEDELKDESQMENNSGTEPVSSVEQKYSSCSKDVQNSDLSTDKKTNKNNETNLKELFADDSISTVSCSRFYSNVSEFSKNSYMDEDKLEKGIYERTSNHNDNLNVEIRSFVDKTSNKSDLRCEENKNNRDMSSELNSDLLENSISSFNYVEETDNSHKLISSQLDAVHDNIHLNNEGNKSDSDRSLITSHSLTDNIEERLGVEECHVVPRIEDSRDDYILYRNENSSTSDQVDSKPRHSSIDSVLDSALGDSCSSTDCQKVINTESTSQEEDLKFDHLNVNTWHHMERQSLASRLPENSYYQIKPGKYIFPGAEVYSQIPWNQNLIYMDDLQTESTQLNCEESQKDTLGGS